MGRSLPMFTPTRAWLRVMMSAQVLAVSFIVGTGCGPRQRDGSSVFPHSDARGSATREPRVVLDPSPLLRFVRSGREKQEIISRERWKAERESARRSSGGDWDDDEPTRDDEEASNEVRRMVIRTGGLATWDDLIEYGLRWAENRRSRDVHAARLLLRQRGPMSVRAKHPVAGRALRRRVRQMLREARTGVKRCVLQAEARRSFVLVKAPEAFVVEQAMAAHDVVYRFTIRLRPTDLTVTSSAGSPARLDEAAKRCIGDAMRAPGVDLPAGRADVPLVVFAQSGHGEKPPTLHAFLAREAAVLGWFHYERGDLREALAYFRDAEWVYHQPEFHMLIGMTLQALGERRRASQAFARYVRERPAATDAPEVRARLQRLRRPRTRSSQP